MTVTTTRNGDRLYVRNGRAFLARTFGYGAYGGRLVSGTLFGLTEDDPLVQRDARAWGPDWASEYDLVAANL
jgi:hypothetical protein